MTKTTDDTRAAIAATFAKQIAAVLDTVMIRPAHLSSSTETAAREQAIEHLADHFAGHVVKAAQLGQETRKHARKHAATVADASRLAHAAAVHVMQATAEELAWEDWTARTFGSERKYDPETGQRIQTVRIVR